MIPLKRTRTTSIRLDNTGHENRAPGAQSRSVTTSTSTSPREEGRH